MKLIRFGDAGNEQPGLILESGTRIDVSECVEDYNEKFFGGDGLAQLAQWVAQNASDAPVVPELVRLGPAIARPSKIICIGLNFSDHAEETGATAPDEPIVFFKATSAWSGPNDP
ncbi:MAG: ureidoglycolate lyase, partial [Verrucomicrobiales bacterium]